MTDLLKRLDYVYKKPKVLPGKHPDPQVQQAFIEKYETLKQTKSKQDPIYFMDGTHPRHNPVAAFGWTKRGVNKTLENNTGRKRVNINGAVAVESLDVEVDFAKVFCEGIKDSLASLSRKSILAPKRATRKCSNLAMKTLLFITTH